MKYPSSNAQELWQSAVEFYKDIVDEDNGDQGPMLDLVQWLSTSDYSNHFYPSTSHQWLCISTVPAIPERYSVPMISVVYHAQQKHFIIKYKDQHGRATAILHCQSEHVTTALQALLLRLSMETIVN